MEKEYIIALNGQQKMDYEKVLEWSTLLIKTGGRTIPERSSVVPSIQ